jgi:hypothetical protein
MHTSITPRFLVPLLLSLLAACGTGHAPDYLGALPTASVLDVPQAPISSSAWTPEPATRSASGAVAAVLERVNTLTADKFPQQAGNVLEWRSLPGLTDSVLWRVRLELDGGTWSSPGLTGEPSKPAQSWRWVLQVRPKMAADATFTTVAEGTRQTPEGDWEARLGGGTFRADFRAACAVLERSACAGDYARNGTVVDASFTLAESGRALTLDASEVLPGGTVHAVELQGATDASGAGTLQVSERYEYAASVPWSGVPHARRMRWSASGAGRLDYSGPWTDSLGAWGVMRSETCWNEAGAELYHRETDFPWAAPTVGSASACGEFTQAASLP